MAIRRLNHAVLYVRDVTRSLAFYQDVLGFRVVHQFPGAAFLQAPDSDNDHDLGLFQIGEQAGPSTAGRESVGLYHLAWSVTTLTDLAEHAAGCARRAPWSAPRTTSRPRPSTPRTRTGWSSRCRGWFHSTG